MSVYFEIRYYNTEALKQAERNGDPIPKDDWLLWSDARRETGKEAADRVAELKELHGEEHTFTIVRVDTLGGDRNYLMRELTRLHDGTYKPIPGQFPDTMPETFEVYWTPEAYEQQFAKVSFQQFLMQQNPDHVPHISQNNERKIAFTESMEKGRKDIQKALHAHEYLSKYLNIRYIEYGPMDLIIEAMGGLNYKLHLTETVEEMVEIYRECDTSREVGSCMTHSTCSYESHPHHPVEPYALGGDLKLAYVRADGDKGTIWGRCLVWPEHGQYTRIYSTNAALMRKVLKAAGFTEFREALEGAKLGVIRLEGDKIVLPYIDGSQSADWDGETLRIAYSGEGNTSAGNTSGIGWLGDEDNSAACDNCGDRYNSDNEGTYITDQGNYCDHCAEEYTYYCDGYDQTYDHRNVDMYNVGDQTYSAYYYENHCFQCEACDEDFHNDDLCFDEPTNQTLCTNCSNELQYEREDALDTIAQIITGNWEATEPQAAPAAAAETAPVIDIDMSGRIAPSDIPSGITVPIGFAVWQPQRPHHAPQFWTNYPTLSALVTTAQLRNNIPQGELRRSSWNFDSTDSYYIVPIGTITGAFTPYSLAAAA